MTIAAIAAVARCCFMSIVEGHPRGRTGSLAELAMIAALTLGAGSVFAADSPSPKPLKILLVTGGCCHDYTAQKELLKQGLEERAHVEVTYVQQGGTATDSKIPLYEDENWAKGYDLVIHDECFSGVKEVAWSERILKPHRAGLPAVVLHCAMHCYQNGTDNWREFCGVTSRRHGAGYAHEVLNRDGSHPIMQKFGAGWLNPAGELYWIEKVWPSAHPLASAKNRELGNEEVCVWTNDFHGTKVFGTTLGHHNETVSSPQYLDLVTRGSLWACGKLNDEYLKPQGKRWAPVNMALHKPVTTSTTENHHPPQDAVDGKGSTRWCASSGAVPQWLQVDLGAPHHLSSCKLSWEQAGANYRYTIDGSTDGKEWRQLVDHSQPNGEPKFQHEFSADNVRYVRMNCVGTPGGFVSVWEFEIYGDEKVEVSPIDFAKEKSIEQLKKLKKPEGYDMTVFATPPAVEYPVYVAAAPDGVTYVSVDKNGSLDRDKNRGAIYRLRDLDGDGIADECKLFVANVDSPRGLVWDRDRLYVMHPPHLSAFIDKDGDGISDEEQVLVKNIAFGFKDRPADHTSNGVSLGIDGWLYLAIGDFGFLEAEGTDGRKLQFRGGGVVRVRPDGTGIEIFSRGTRNILEVAIDPLLNGFTRDNTNDGGGWDIRLHHFTGLEDHGYPRLFKNFGDEIIQPLADYGGGSGCGAMYLDEPGFPASDSPAVYTADWGRDYAYRHHMTASGATFKPDQFEFLQLPRITDLDVDGNSAIFATSWQGATFNYNGEEVGYMVRLTPKGYQPAPLPDFAKLDEAGLIGVLKSPSHRRRLAAQRELLARGVSKSASDSLMQLAGDPKAPLASRAVATFALKQGLGAASHASLAKLAEDATLRPLAIRALTDRWDQLDNVSASTLVAGLADANPRTRLEAALALARLGKVEHAAAIVPLVADADSVIAHTAVQSLIRLKAADAAFAIVDRSNATGPLRSGSLRVLQSLHEPVVVDGLISRLGKETDATRRRGLLVALARLYNHEGTWTGVSWGTRPDTTGPYYQPETWSESPKIGAALKQALDRAGADDAAFLLAELTRNRVRLDGTIDTLLAMAAKDPALLPTAVSELARRQDLPSAALPLLKSVVHSEEFASLRKAKPEVIAQAIVALLKSDDPDAFKAVLSGVKAMGQFNYGPVYEQAKSAFLQPSALGRHVETLSATATTNDEHSSLWADAGLLTLAANKDTSPEVRALAYKSIDALWATPTGRKMMLKAALFANDRTMETKALAAVADPDSGVASAAKEIVKRWKLENRPTPAGPLVQALKPEAVIAEAVKHPGDASRGEQLFTRINCAKCHTVKEGEPLRGPFLPQVAKTYKRDQIAEAILLPNKSIAQGFVTNLFVLDDGKTVTGFITNEAADEITLRDAEGREIKLPVSKIEERVKQNISMMPEGLAKDLSVEEFSALVSYVESLAAQAGK
jgi:putative heme-binding domain-containing protein